MTKLKLISNLSLIKILALLFITTSITTKETPTPEYIDYVVEIENAFIKEMEKRYGLSFTGSGGRMPYNVQKIEIIFSAFYPTTIEQAREIEVWGTKKILAMINQHEKLRPFLAEYPFTSKHIDISVAFLKDDGSRYTDGKVTYIFTANNKIFYRSAAMVTRMTNGFSDLRDPKNRSIIPLKK